MSSPVPNGATPHEPSGTLGPDRPRPPVPLVLSCVAGAAGFLLLVAGAVVDSTGLSVAGFVAGSLSLGAALYWRSLLISSWAVQRRGRSPR